MTYRTKFTIAMACAVAWLVSASVYALAPMGEEADRDKSGTTGVQKKRHGSQAAVAKALTSRFSFEAEGMGLEPTTP
jgi:hypothetical protein